MIVDYHLLFLLHPLSTILLLLFLLAVHLTVLLLRAVFRKFIQRLQDSSLFADTLKFFVAQEYSCNPQLLMHVVPEVDKLCTNLPTNLTPLTRRGIWHPYSIGNWSVLADNAMGTLCNDIQSLIAPLVGERESDVSVVKGKGYHFH